MRGKERTKGGWDGMGWDRMGKIQNNQKSMVMPDPLFHSSL